MPRVVTDRELRAVERWAKATKLSKILSFFESLPDPIVIRRPMLLGSNNRKLIYIHGFMSPGRVCDEVQNLDEPFDTQAPLKKKIILKKRQAGDVSRPALAAVFRALRKGLDEVCLLQGIGPCDGGIARAHSIQKGAFSRLATDNHVYHFDPFSPNSLGRGRAKRIGIKRATTFTGFCRKHDAETFAPIETTRFRATDEQIFLFHYRALAHTYYSRVHTIKVIRAAYDDLVTRVTPSESKWLRERLWLNDHDVTELRALKTRYDHFLREGKMPRVAYCAMSAAKTPDVLVTEFLAPGKDFRGGKIQDGKSLAQMDWLSVSVTVVNGEGIVLICAEPEHTTFRRFVTSLESMQERARSEALVTFIFCQCENFILLPRWWDGLSHADRVTYFNAFQGRYFPRCLPSLPDWELSEWGG